MNTSAGHNIVVDKGYYQVIQGMKPGGLNPWEFLVFSASRPGGWKPPRCSSRNLSFNLSFKQGFFFAQVHVGSQSCPPVFRWKNPGCLGHPSGPWSWVAIPGPASVLILACRMESAMKRRGNHGKPSKLGRVESVEVYKNGKIRHAIVQGQVFEGKLDGVVWQKD